MATTNPAALAKRMTVDEFWDFCQLPENAGRRLELIRGKVVDRDEPFRQTVQLTRRLGDAIARSIRDAGLPPGDVLFIDKTGRFADADPAWPTLPPRLVIEVPRPKGGYSRTIERTIGYHNAGVRMVWLVDSKSPLVSMYPSDSRLRVVHEDEELDGGDFLPGFHHKIADFYDPLAAEEQPTPSQV